MSLHDAAGRGENGGAGAGVGAGTDVGVGAGTEEGHFPTGTGREGRVAAGAERCWRLLLLPLLQYKQPVIDIYTISYRI